MGKRGNKEGGREWGKNEREGFFRDAVWMERLYPVRSLRADRLHKIAPIPYIVRIVALLNNKISININLHLFYAVYGVF